MASPTRSTARRAPQVRSGAESAKVLPADVRHLHRTLLLSHLYKSEPKSRADLARATGLTRVTVSDVVADLLDRKLVEEVGTRPGTRVGKPATLVTVDYTSHALVCLDLSRETEFRGAITSLDGDILYRDAIELGDDRGDTAVTKVTQLAHRLIDNATVPVLGIGVGTPVSSAQKAPYATPPTSDGVTLNSPATSTTNSTFPPTSPTTRTPQSSLNQPSVLETPTDSCSSKSDLVSVLESCATPTSCAAQREPPEKSGTSASVTNTSSVPAAEQAASKPTLQPHASANAWQGSPRSCNARTRTCRATTRTGHRTRRPNPGCL